MVLKKVFIDAKQYIKLSFKRDSKFIIAFSFIFFAVSILSDLFLESFLSIIVTIVAALVLPIVTIGYAYISDREVNGKEVLPRFFYSGFLNYSMSISIATSVILGPILFLILGGLVGAIISGLIMSGIITSKSPDIIVQLMNLESIDQGMELISSLPYIDTLAIFSDEFILLCGLLFVGIFSLKNIYTPYIKFNSGFNVFVCSNESKEFYRSNSKQIRTINILFMMFLFIVYSLDIVLLFFLTKLELNNVIIYTIIDLIKSLLIGFGLYYYLFVVASSYKIYLSDFIKDKNENFLKVIELAQQNKNKL